MLKQNNNQTKTQKTQTKRRLAMKKIVCFVAILLTALLTATANAFVYRDYGKPTCKGDVCTFLGHKYSKKVNELLKKIKKQVSISSATYCQGSMCMKDIGIAKITFMNQGFPPPIKPDITTIKIQSPALSNTLNQMFLKAIQRNGAKINANYDITTAFFLFLAKNDPKYFILPDDFKISYLLMLTAQVQKALNEGEVSTLQKLIKYFLKEYIH